MSEITKTKLLAMIDNEMQQVVGDISNETLWANGSTTKEECQMHYDNVADLVEYQTLLLIMRKQIVEGEFNV